MSKVEFIVFLEELKADFEKNKQNWENKTIDSYLDAMARYAEDIQGYYDNSGQEIDADKPDWQTFSDIMKGAAIYE